MKLKSLIQYTLISLMALLLLFTIIISWLIATESGLRFMVNAGASAIPELKVEQINGRLIGPLSIEKLHYKNQQIGINLGKVELNWQPSNLFLSSVIVNYLNISSIEIKQLSKPAPSEKNSSQAPTIDEIIKQLQLPYAITLDKIDIQDVYYDGDFYKGEEAKDKNTPFTVRQLLFSAKSDSQKIRVENLKFDSNIAQFDGNIKLGLSKKEDSLGEIKWQVKKEKQEKIPSIKGSTHLSGNTKKLVIKNTVETPYSTNIEIIINKLTTHPSAHIIVALEKINPNNINNEWPNYIIDGDITIEGDINKATFNSVLLVENNMASKQPSNTIHIDTQGDWADEELKFSLNSSAPSVVETLTIDGIVKPTLLQSTSATEAIELSINWLNLNKVNNKPSENQFSNNAESNTIYSPKGEFLFKGNLNQFFFDLVTSLEMESENQQSGQLLINGSGSQEALSFNQIKLTGPIGTLDGKGEIITQPNVSADIVLSGKNLNPGVLAPEWPGQLALDLMVKTDKDNNKLVINSTINSHGKLRDYPFSLSTTGSFTEDNIHLRKLDIKSGNSIINATAELKNNQLLSADWKLNSTNLQELIPNTEGKLNSKGSIESVPIKINASTPITPAVNITLLASQLSIADSHIETLDTDIDIDWRPNTNNSNSYIHIDSNNINLNEINLASASFQFDGKPENHKINTQINSNKGNVQFSVSGQALDLLTQPRWLFSLNQASLSPQDLPPWQLTNTVKGSLSGAQQNIDQHCWSSTISPTKKSQLCFNAQHQNGKLNTNFNIKQFHTEYLSPLLPDGLSWADTIISGQGKIGIPNPGKLNSSIQLTSSPGKLIWTQLSANTQQNEKEKLSKTPVTQSIDFGTGKLSITSDDDALSANINLPIEQQTGINAKVQIQNKVNTSFVEKPMTGQLNLRLNNLSPLVSFIPDASELEGSLLSQWKIGGSIQQPWLDGELSLKKGQMRLNTPGILVEDIALLLKGSRQNGIHYTLDAQSGGGSLKTKGNINLNEKRPDIRLTLEGQAFQVFNTDEATVYASPDLTITTKNQTIDINGSVTIPKASITPEKIPESVVTVSDDQIIVDKNNQAKTTTIQQYIKTNIDLILGDNVEIDGFGFKGKTSGKLRIKKEKQGPTLGNGKINIIDGEYRAFGQGLVIEKGVVIFSNGPIAKPGIDIKALRRPAEGITVGVFARGNLTQPNLTIFSDPSMTQTEQLSWLILGRPPEQSSEGENNAINQLLLSLTLSKGDSILTSLSDKFNLDTLTIKTGSGEAGAASDNDLAELVLGKYLSPELYVSYGIGLFKPVNVLSLEYSLGRHWKLTSETSSESSGGDVVYTIER